MPHPFGTYFQLLITQFFLLLVRPMPNSSLKEFCLVTHRTFRTPPFFFTSHFPLPPSALFLHFSLSLLLLFYFHYFLGLCHGFFLTPLFSFFFSFLLCIMDDVIIYVHSNIIFFFFVQL